MSDLPQKIRAFIAMRVSSEVEHAIEEFSLDLRADGDGIKWVPPANLHLTLKFLGPAVPVEKIDRLKPELERIAASTRPFDIEAAGAGGFPNLKHPNILWIGLRGNDLRDLAARIDDAAVGCGFAREQRAFNAHLTIGRLKRGRLDSRLCERIDQASSRTFGISRIGAMTLYRSITAPTGSIYQALQVFSLNS